jgi:serine/threonine protein kinase
MRAAQQRILEKRYASSGYTIEPVEFTKHSNVLRLRKGSKSYIAKFIFDYSKVRGFTDMVDPKSAFENESNIYRSLPSWWGIQLLDAFDATDGDAHFYVIVTSEISSCSWSSLPRKSYKAIAAQLHKQVRWLHAHKIAHNDLELKNILVSCDGKRATIIDFEKSIVNASASELARDKERMSTILKEHDSALAAAYNGTPRKTMKTKKRTTRKQKSVGPV